MGHGQIGDAQRRLGHPRVRDGAALIGALFGAEGGPGKQRLPPARVDDRLQLRKSDEQLGQHAGPLAALTGEKQS
jgi:hypothetical protein